MGGSGCFGNEGMDHCNHSSYTYEQPASLITGGSPILYTIIYGDYLGNPIRDSGQVQLSGALGPSRGLGQTTGHKP